MSAQQLADQCKELGLTLNRQLISNLENGRRDSVSVAELFVLAKALNVPPLLLTVPLGHEPTTEILPGRVGDTWLAAKWITGEGRPIPAPVLDDSLQPQDLFRMHDHFEREIIAARLSADNARRMASQATTDAEREAHLRTAEAYDIRERQAAGALAALRKFMRTRDLVIPPLRSDWPALAGIAEQETDG